jgi:SPP1 gp7 family putative phage head morphogenesis protein
MDRIRQQTRGAYSEAELNARVAAVTVNLESMHKNGWERQAAALGIRTPLFQSEPWKGVLQRNFIQDNVKLIESAHIQDLDKLESIVGIGLRQGWSVKELTKGIQKQFEVSDKYAKFLATDQTLKFFGELTEQRQKDAGVESYTWDTSQDERVRSTHEDLHGKEFRWDDPPVSEPDGSRYHPGQSFRCRCQAIPVFAS